MAEVMSGSSEKSSGLDRKAQHMADIRAERHGEGFREATVWLPEEDIDDFRDKAWEAVDACGREFPHRSGRRRRSIEK